MAERAVGIQHFNGIRGEEQRFFAPKTVSFIERRDVLNGQTLGELYLHQVLSILSEQGKQPQEELLRERLMQSACKHAIKGGEPVREEEIAALLETFLSGEVPLTCPHGRPVVVRITEQEIEKMFRRIV